MAATIFDRLCDLVDELGRIEYRMPHSPEQLALCELMTRFDALIDQTVGLEGTMELDLDPDVTRAK